LRWADSDSASQQPAPETKTGDPPHQAQAKELFRSVDDILHFASDDTKLPVKHEVKRKLQTRASVERYVIDKFNDDEDAKRMQRSEIVLKKFGLLDRDFQLKPFLVSLLTEQIAGYYDSKTKTVNLLDWIAPDSQKPVLAHELTHALQDQHVDLDKWEDKSLSDLSKKRRRRQPAHRHRRGGYGARGGARGSGDGGICGLFAETVGEKVADFARYRGNAERRAQRQFGFASDGTRPAPAAGIAIVSLS
jgi:hypothetical protein